MHVDTKHCERCGYNWLPRSVDPGYCPRCHAPLKKWKETGAIAAKLTTPAVSSQGVTT